jgi:hypothetical protein
MLTAAQIDALRDRSGQLLDPIIDFLIEDIAKRVSEAGQFTGTASYQAWKLQKLGVSQRQLKKEIAKRLKISQKEAEQLLTQAAETGYNFDMSRFPTSHAIPLSANFALQQVLDATVKLAKEDLTNMTQTIGFVGPDGQFRALTDAYNQACDFAFQKVSTGAQDYVSAVREATANLAKKGIRTIDYESGVHTSLEAAVRRNIMGGLGLMQEKISESNHDLLGCDGWEISAHAASAPDHEPIQGKQYTDEEYTRLNNSLVRRIGTLHCGHIAFGIILGVHSPQYTPEELENLRLENEEGITYNGKHYTLYEAIQRQRNLEQAAKDRKRRILIDEQLGDKDKLQNDQIRLQMIKQEYSRFSKAAGLPTQHARMEKAGFTWKHGKAAENSYKAIAKEANSMYDIGSTEKNVAAWLRDQPIRKKIGSEQYPLTVYQGRQNKHIVGTHEYKQYVVNLTKKGEYGPSRLSIDENAIKLLVEKYHGTGILLKRKDGSWREIERITVHPEKIGVAVNNLTGAEADTTVFTIRYSGDGVHIVPDYPSRKGEKAKE